MSEELLKMYGQLTQEVSLCQDEDIRVLGKGILELAKNYDNSLKEIERLNNILDTLMQDMVSLNATGIKKEIKPKYVYDRIAMLRGVDKE